MFNPEDIATFAVLVLVGGSLVTGFLFGYLVRDYFADKRTNEIIKDMEDRINALRG